MLVAGDTCWRLAAAARAAVLIDAVDYFTALRSSLLAARHSVLILGWELHSKMRLEGTRRPHDGAPAELGALLRWILRHRPELELRILLWNHPTLYAIHRELFPRFIFGHRKLERVDIRLDSHLPLGASHHEKLVIIDDNVAYCGGIDLTVRRWDTTAHHPAEPRRHYGGSRDCYVPMHDVQMVVDGEAAAALGERARARWVHAGGPELDPVTPRGDCWPAGVRADFENVDVGIVRTLAALEKPEEEIREVERSTIAAISRAERLVYIENQYVTSKSACEALRARMLRVPKLEAIVVTTREPGGWLEAEVMGVGRQQFMAAFAEKSLADRIHFVAPVATGPAVRAIGDSADYSIHVHAKVLVVDDRFLRVGSSNLNNRSMGFDTECDLAIEASTAAQRRAIAAIRARLVAEHWGSDVESTAQALAKRRGVWTALASLPQVPVHSTAHGARYRRLAVWRRAERAQAQRTVVPLPQETVADAGLVVQLGDPERAVSAEQLLAQAVGVRQPRKLLRWGGGLLAVTLVALLLVMLDRAGFGILDLGAKLVDGIGALGQSPWGIPLVLAAFVVGSLLAVPIVALIGATVIALGPVVGFACAATGTLLAATATFGVGRLVGRQPLQRWLGKRFRSLEQRFSDRGIIAVALIRKVPIAPFTIVNMLIGAIGIRYRDFLLGTSLGMLPGIAAFAFVSDRVLDAWREPTPQNLALIAGALVLWLGVVLGVQQLANRRTR